MPTALLLSPPHPQKLALQTTSHHQAWTSLVGFHIHCPPLGLHTPWKQQSYVRLLFVDFSSAFKHNLTHDTDRKTLPAPVQFLWCCKKVNEAWIKRESKMFWWNDERHEEKSWVLGFEYFTVYFTLLDYQWKVKEWTPLTFLPHMKHLQDFHSLRSPSQQLTLTSLNQWFSNFL